MQSAEKILEKYGALAKHALSKVFVEFPIGVYERTLARHHYRRGETVDGDKVLLETAARAIRDKFDVMSKYQGFRPDNLARPCTMIHSLVTSVVSLKGPRDMDDTVGKDQDFWLKNNIPSIVQLREEAKQAGFTIKAICQKASTRTLTDRPAELQIIFYPSVNHHS